MKKTNNLEDPNHPYVGGEVLDMWNRPIYKSVGNITTEPKTETWRDRFELFYLEKRNERRDTQWTGLLPSENMDFFQQELERIKNNFMKEFTDPDDGLINIGKYDHDENINFFNKEIK